MTKEIPLTQGMVALVDDQDYDFLMQWNWFFKNHRTGYAARQERMPNGKQHTILMHEAVLKTSGDVRADHRDHNTLDNRRDNLRPATRYQNARNQRKPSRGKTSQFKGVNVDKRTGRYVAKITFTNPDTRIKRSHYLGTFDDQVSAAQAYDTAARKHFGQFACTNFNDEVICE